MQTAICADCGEQYNVERWRLGYYTCQPCGEVHARNVRSGWTVAQLYSKGNYQLVTDPTDLMRTNPKRTV